MSNLENHAEREMRLAGLYDKDADYGGMIPETVMAMVGALSGRGHSGGSHAMVMQIFNRVANFKTLTPITANSDEWNEIETGKMWQSNRQSSVFSKDGGKTWYDIDKEDK